MVPAWFTRFTTDGDTGADVRIIQRKLGLPVTGQADTAFTVAVRGFQQSRRLTPTGVVDPQTATLLGEKAARGTLPEWFRHDVTGDDECCKTEALNALQLPGQPDGTFTELVARFQSAHGLQPSGILDAETATVLNGVT